VIKKKKGGTEEDKTKEGTNDKKSKRALELS